MEVLPPSTALGDAVRSRRKALSLSQADLGRLAGTGRIFVSSLEAGKRTLRLDKVLSVLEVLGLRFTIEQGRGGIKRADDVPTD